LLYSFCAKEHLGWRELPVIKSRAKVLNLTFHGVGEHPKDAHEDGASTWLSVEQFKFVLDFINGRQGIFITFDDGNKSDVEVALPLLLERGIKAAFFVCPGNFDSSGYLTGGDVRSLSRAGMIIGSHGMYHRDWRQLKNEELMSDLLASRKILEKETKQPISYVACPGGSYDRRVLNYLRKAGYDRVYTSDTGYSRPDAFLQARNTIRSNITTDLLRRIIEQRTWNYAGFIRVIKKWIKRWR
jgi:peptidoglycan/xylan/chitin deacetylase (PgdA/CDA1 family)